MASVGNHEHKLKPHSHSYYAKDNHIHKTNAHTHSSYSKNGHLHDYAKTSHGHSHVHSKLYSSLEHTHKPEEHNHDKYLESTHFLGVLTFLALVILGVLGYLVRKVGKIEDRQFKFAEGGKK